MRILVIGAGGVGASMASIAETRSFFDHFVLADISLARAEEAISQLDNRAKFAAAHVDARDKMSINTGRISRISAGATRSSGRFSTPRLSERCSCHASMVGIDARVANVGA